MQVRSVGAVDLDFQHSASKNSSIHREGEIAIGRPQRLEAIIEDARRRARRRRIVVVLALASVAGAVTAVVLSGGFGHGSSPGSLGSNDSSATGSGIAEKNREVVVDGVIVYATELSGGGTLYSLDPLSAADRTAAAQLGSGVLRHATTGDLKGCEFLAARPGRVVPGCALMLAQYRGGVLQPTVGPAQVAHTVCGERPAPGEVAACHGEVVSEAQVQAAVAALRAALKRS
jgi:hypothetical protein